VVFVTGPLQDEGKDKLPVLANDGPESAAGIPVLQLRTSAAQRLLAPSGIDLARFQADVDRDLRPRSRPAGIRLQGTAALWSTTASSSCRACCGSTGRAGRSASSASRPS
jgi:hypothetical protein